MSCDVNTSLQIVKRKSPDLDGVAEQSKSVGIQSPRPNPCPNPRRSIPSFVFPQHRRTLITDVRLFPSVIIISDYFRPDNQTSVHTETTQAMTSNKLMGSCACGNIRYTSTAPPTHLDFCYCLTCQRISGAPFMAWMGIPSAVLVWTVNSADQSFTYRSLIGDTGVSVAERLCCGVCGCNMRLQYDLYPAKTHVAAATIVKNDLPMPEVGCHIWTRHVPAWYRVSEDGVKRYWEFDEEFQAKLDEYLRKEKGTA